MSNAWWMLLGAGALEIVWASLFKRAFENDHVITAITLTAMIASFSLLADAMKEIPIGTAYAVWTGIGAVGAAIVGMIIYKEPATFARILCIVLIVAGIAGLKLTAGRA
ncbi:MAG: QacE family quaternary ammonium compound efflux SMR transporter [Alphaproteobacteria bacterium]|nr:QacE family quaternary ammonium compound efflux SMR transporter [Alphaproteobacteria bacterium]